MTQYQIIKAQLGQLTDAVNAQCALGWEPIGAPFEASLGGIYGQAMVAEAKPQSADSAQAESIATAPKKRGRKPKPKQEASE